MNNEKIIVLIIFFFIIINTSSALVIQGIDSNGNVYTSDGAQGTIVEKNVLSSDNTYNSSIFSWGCPLINATNANLGVSASGNIYVLTLGPDITDPIPSSIPVSPVLPSTPESSSSVPSSSGGGGGSSTQDTYGLIIGDILTVKINDEPHTITITNIFESSAVITVDEKYIVELNVNEEKEIDLNNDGINELSITLDNVSELRKITITVSNLIVNKLEEEVVEETETSFTPSLNRITGGVSAVDVQQIEEIGKQISKTTSTIITYLVVLNLIGGILFGSIYSVKKIKQRRIYAVFHAQSKEDMVKQQLAKVQSYVSIAMDSNRTVSSIKQELLSQGWQEYEIDSIMVDAMLKEQGNFNQIL
ncbi:MAG: hypothetical protein WC254_05870 [Candidatus Woesearchaeota archaeon]|jgi:hypothetical protein